MKEPTSYANSVEDSTEDSVARVQAEPESAPEFDRTSESVSPRFRWRSVWMPAALVALTGLLNVWSAVTSGMPGHLKVLWDVLPFDARRGSHLTAALMGFALLLLAHGLGRRKTASWALAMGALSLSAIAHLLKGLDYEEAVVALSMVVWLWLAQRQFFARSDRPLLRRGLRVLAMAFAFTLFYGTLGFYLLDREFRVNFNLAAALRETVAMFTSFSNPGLEPTRGLGRSFADSIYIIATATFGYSTYQHCYVT